MRARLTSSSSQYQELRVMQEGGVRRRARQQLDGADATHGGRAAGVREGWRMRAAAGWQALRRLRQRTTLHAGCGATGVVALLSLSGVAGGAQAAAAAHGGGRMPPVGPRAAGDVPRPDLWKRSAWPGGRGGIHQLPKRSAIAIPSCLLLRCISTRIWSSGHGAMGALLPASRPFSHSPCAPTPCTHSPTRLRAMSSASPG